MRLRTPPNAPPGPTDPQTRVFPRLHSARALLVSRQILHEDAEEGWGRGGAGRLRLQFRLQQPTCLQGRRRAPEGTGRECGLEKMTMAARGDVCEKKGAKIARGPPGREACVELQAATALECVRRPASIERINARAHYSSASNVCVLCPSIYLTSTNAPAPPQPGVTPRSACINLCTLSISTKCKKSFVKWTRRNYRMEAVGDMQRRSQAQDSSAPPPIAAPG